MVITRGLCQTLGRVLGREVSGDEEKTPQHWRSTTSTSRQQEAVTVAKDIEHMDHAADEAHEEPHDSIMKDVGVDS